MKVKDYKFQAYMHGAEHVDVELMFPDRPTIKMCHITSYLGGVDSFGDAATFAAKMRLDLQNLLDSDEEVIIKRDVTDGSIDLFRKSDGALMWSATAERIEGADWVTIY